MVVKPAKLIWCRSHRVQTDWWPVFTLQQTAGDHEIQLHFLTYATMSSTMAEKQYESCSSVGIRWQTVQCTKWRPYSAAHTAEAHGNVVASSQYSDNLCYNCLKNSQTIQRKMNIHPAELVHSLSAVSLNWKNLAPNALKWKTTVHFCCTPEYNLAHDIRIWGRYADKKPEKFSVS